MKLAFYLTVLAAIYCTVDSTYSAPKVQVYSHTKGLFGADNTLICHVSDFHPPDIKIELMKEGKPLGSDHQTDLAFKPNWHFHLTKNAPFKPEDGEVYSCLVTHGGFAKDYAWEPNM